jgi:hypothetical protein
MKSGLLLFANDRKNFASIENHERWKSFKNGYYSGPPWLHSWLNMVVRTPQISREKEGKSFLTCYFLKPEQLPKM